MKDDMTHGWLLVASALSDLGYDNISELSDAVNSFIETGSALDDETKNIQKKAAWSSKEHRDAEIRRARSVLGIPNTPLNAYKVKSPVELAAFKKKGAKGGAAGCTVGNLSGPGRNRTFQPGRIKESFLQCGSDLGRDRERS